LPSALNLCGHRNAAILLFSVGSVHSIFCAHSCVPAQPDNDLIHLNIGWWLDLNDWLSKVEQEWRRKASDRHATRNLVRMPYRKRGQATLGRETGTFYFFRSAGSMGSKGISLRVRERRRSNRPSTRREMGHNQRLSTPLFSFTRPDLVALPVEISRQRSAWDGSTRNGPAGQGSARDRASRHRSTR
jgi:hypothetical protein